MSESFNFYNPVRIHFGLGILKRLPELIAGRRSILVTSPGWGRRLTEADPAFFQNFIARYDEVQPNPDLRSLARCYAAVHEHPVELIVGLGGGSVLDTCKVLAVKSGDSGFDDLIGLIKSPSLFEGRELIPMIAIPTTAGTGSEVTPWGTVWDTDSKCKYSITRHDLWFESCICDAELTCSLPWDITLHTALDALSHALESIWNVRANPISTSLAISAAKTIVSTLPKMAGDLNNVALRERLLSGSLLAGLAFSQTQTSLAHAISYYLTLVKSVPHGLAASFSLPVLAEVILGRHDAIDFALRNIFGFEPAVALRELFLRLEVPSKLSQFGIDSKEEILALRTSVEKYPQAKSSLFSLDEVFKQL